MNSLRTAIELNVIAYNTPLRDVVKKMDIIILLRNCHPIDRSVFALSLLRDNQITKEQAKEFVKLV